MSNILFAPWANSQSQFTKKIKKSYKINQSTTVDIYNKYGKIIIMSWDKDSVMFDIELNINAPNDSKLNKIKNIIDFDFTGTEYYIIAKTKIGKETKGWLSDLKDLASALVSSDNKVIIDYIVKIPSYATLKVENKFGDIYLDDYNGNININLSNGEFKANNLYGNSVLNLSSADGNINYIKEGKLLISYSDCTVKKAEKVILDSRSSKIYINKIVFLKIQSRRDKFYIPVVSEMYGEGYWSDFHIHSLRKELNCDFKFGNVAVDQISRSFSFINILSEHTDVDLVFDKGTSYDMDIIYNEDANIVYPQKLGSFQTKDYNKDEDLKLIYGKVGSGTKLSKVKINALKKCYINIFHK